MKKAKSLRNDLILIISLLLIGILGMLYLFCFRKAGDTVKVTVDGEIFGIYRLNENATIEINGSNRIKINDGKVYMEWADCPDNICVNHTPVFRNGESIICLPNGIVVTVITSDKNNPDIVI